MLKIKLFRFLVRENCSYAAIICDSIYYNSYAISPPTTILLLCIGGSISFINKINFGVCSLFGGSYQALNLICSLFGGSIKHSISICQPIKAVLGSHDYHYLSHLFCIKAGISKYQWKRYVIPKISIVLCFQL